MISLEEAAKFEDKGGGKENKVFAPGVRYQFPKTTGDKTLAVLPAIAKPDDLLQWAPYRDEHDRFTNWVQAFIVHKYLGFPGKKFDIISPLSFDSTVIDPVQLIYNTAKNNPDFQHLVGIDKNGKRVEDYTSIVIPNHSTEYVMNCVDLDSKKPDADNAFIQVVPKTAFMGSGGKEARPGTWGLKAALDTPSRKKGAIQPGSFEEYYWGDITNPFSLIPCSLRKDKPPSGAKEIYNMTPLDISPLKAKRKWLETRQSLSKSFLRMEISEYLDLLFELFADYPNLLRLAFRNRFPESGIEERLKKVGAIPSAKAVSSPESEKEKPAETQSITPTGAAHSFAEEDKTEEIPLDEENDEIPGALSEQTSSAPTGSARSQQTAALINDLLH